MPFGLVAGDVSWHASLGASVAGTVVGASLGRLSGRTSAVGTSWVASTVGASGVLVLVLVDVLVESVTVGFYRLDRGITPLTVARDLQGLISSMILLRIVCNSDFPAVASTRC